METVGPHLVVHNPLTVRFEFSFASGSTVSTTNEVYIYLQIRAGRC